MWSWSAKSPEFPVTKRSVGDNDLVHQMTARGFRHILQVVVLALVFAVVQMGLLQRVCNDGMKAATALEKQGLPNLNHLADLREQLALFRLHSYEYLFARESEKPRQALAVAVTEKQIQGELAEIKKLFHDEYGQQRVAALATAFAGLIQEFTRMQGLIDKDFTGAMYALDHDLPPKIQLVNNAADALDRFGYQFSDGQAKANFAGFGQIKKTAVVFGAVSIAGALGMVLFVVIAARRTHRQLSEALEQLHQQSRILRLQTSALEAAANGIVITDRQGIIQWVNPAFTRLTGYSAAEATGKTPRVLKSGEHPEAFYAEMWQTVKSGQEWNGELINRRKDGSFYYEEMSITPVRGEGGEIQNFIAVKHDISNRKRFQRELEQEKKLLSSLLDNLPDTIYFKDSESRFTRINRAQARHLGVANPEDAIGKSDADFFPSGEARQKLVDERRMMIAGEPIIGLVERSNTTGEQRWVSSTKVPLRDETGKITGLVGVSRDITAYKQVELERLEMQSRYQMLFESSVEAILIADEKALLDGNPAALKMFRCADKSDLLFHQLAEFLPAQQADGPDAKTTVNQRMAEAFKQGSHRSEWVFQRRDGASFPAEISLVAFAQGGKKLLQVTIRDLTEIKQAEKERQLMEVQLRQSQKLESVGQLAAGIAHEINTPIQYVGDNTRFLEDAFGSIVTMLHDYGDLLATAKAGPVTAAQVAKIEADFASRDIEYFYAQIPTAIQETLEGVGRVSKIVRAMKEFSHPGGQEKAPADLNKAIESTVTVARNEWKYVAELELILAPDLPLVPCFLGEFNQVMLNLIVNAAHAIGDVVQRTPGSKGKITILTQRVSEEVEVRVSDTGTGIAEKHRAKIFEPFFTTKDVGKGTGQGLTVVYSNIVKKHGGTITFETAVGRGTTFIIRLPIHLPVAPPADPGKLSTL